MEESLLSKSNSFLYSKNPVEENRYFVELSDLVKAGNFSRLKKLVKYPDYKAALSCRDSRNGSSLLHLSADKRDFECMALFLEAGINSNVRDKDKRTPLHNVLNGGCRCELCTKKSLDCLDILIKNEANLNAEDKRGRTALYYAAKFMLFECAIVLLDNGADLQHSKSFEDINLSTLVVQKLPGVMEKEFDKCIRYDDDDNSKLRLDFSLILQTASNEQRKIRMEAEATIEEGCSCCSSNFVPCETELLYNVLKASGAGRESFLTHPLTEAFLHLKWMAVRKYFLIFRSVYFFLTALYTVFIYDIYILNCPHDWESNGSKTDREFVADFTVQCEVGPRMFICGVVVASIALIMLLYEFYKMCVDQLTYFTTPLNYAWWILIFSLALTIIPTLGVEIQQWQYPLCAFAVIYAWSMNLVQVARIPGLGVYVEVLARVLKDFGLFLITYSTLLIGFALGFSILMPEHETFYSIPLSFVKVLLMMTGDTDYYRTMSTEDERWNDLEYSIPAHVIYTVFILVMTIVLMSLLIGLAVSDIQQLEKDASVSRSVRLIKEIYILELLTRNNILCCGLASCIAKIFSINKLKCMKRGYVTFSPTDSEDKTFPSELRIKFIPFLSSSPCLHKNSLVKLPSQATTEIQKRFSMLSNSEKLGWEQYVETTEEKYNDLLFSMQEIMQQNQLLKNQMNYITNKLNSIV